MTPSDPSVSARKWLRLSFERKKETPRSHNFGFKNKTKNKNTLSLSSTVSHLVSLFSLPLSHTQFYIQFCSVFGGTLNDKTAFIAI